MSARPVDERYSKLPASTMAMALSRCCSSYGRSCGPQVHTTSATAHPSPHATNRRVVVPAVPAVRRSASACVSSTAISAKTDAPAATYKQSDTEVLMAAFYIGSYDIVNPDEFQKYAPIVL